MVPVACDLVVEHAADPDELAELEDRVRAATRAASGITDDLELAILVHDESGRLVAGVSGGSWGGCCELRDLWVDESIAHRGLGTALMAAAEYEAWRRGCALVVLFTHDVQSHDFYDRLGYETVGVVDGYPKGSAARWMRKLRPGAGEDFPPGWVNGGQPDMRADDQPRLHPGV